MSVLLARRVMVATIFLLGTATLSPAADRLSAARDLVNAMGCLGCHAIGSRGGTLGPALDEVGKRLNREEIQRQLIEPRVKNPASSMPSYRHLTEEQQQLLVDYLLLLR